MPETKFEDAVFTAMMVIVMVYAMICYNISLNLGGVQNRVFLLAFHEMIIMCPVAFLLEFFAVGRTAQKIAFRSVTPGQDKPAAVILTISAVTVCFMCPLMSFFATLFFKHAGSQFIAVWIQTAAMNFPMALCWQIFFAGPLVRTLFRALFRKSSVNVTEKKA